MKPDHISNDLKYKIGNDIIKLAVKKNPAITQNQLRRVFSSLYRRLWHQRDAYFEMRKRIESQRDSEGETE